MFPESLEPPHYIIDQENPGVHYRYIGIAANGKIVLENGDSQILIDPNVFASGRYLDGHRYAIRIRPEAELDPLNPNIGEELNGEFERGHFELVSGDDMIREIVGMTLVNLQLSSLEVDEREAAARLPSVSKAEMALRIAAHALHGIENPPNHENVEKPVDESDELPMPQRSTHSWSTKVTLLPKMIGKWFLSLFRRK